MNNSIPNPDRPSLDDLLDEFGHEFRAGKNPDIDAYLQRCPGREDELRELLETIMMMENLGQQDHAARGKEQRQARFQYLRQTIEEIGDYQIVREVGRGGMGLVYEARQKSLDRQVAIKVLPSLELDGDDSLTVQRFRRESQAAAGLHHTHIVPIFDVGEQDGLFFYVMQFIDGCGIDQFVRHLKSQTSWNPSEFSAPPVIDKILENPSPNQSDLSSRSIGGIDTVKDGYAKNKKQSNPNNQNGTPTLEAHGRSLLPSSYFDFVTQLGIQIADALQYAHEGQVIHRDIKPSNLLLDREAKVWIADFGLAKIDQQQDLTRTGDILGTLQYMAPEQLKGEATAASDLYGIGATLFELLALEPLVDQQPLNEMVVSIAENRTRKELRKLNPKIPKDLATIVNKLVEPNPQRRYRSALELKDDLQRHLNRQPISARPVSQWEHGWRWCQRNPTISTLAASVVILMGMLATLMTWGYFNEASLRAKTEETLELSLAALDQVYDKFAPRESIALDETLERNELARPPLSRESAEILLELLPTYNRLASQSRDNTARQKDAATATARAAEIRFRLGDWDSAVQTYEFAQLRFERLRDMNVDVDYEIAQIQNELGFIELMRTGLTDRKRFNQVVEKLADIEAVEIISERLARKKFELARALHFLANRKQPRVGLLPPPRPHKPLRPELSSQQSEYLERAIQIVKQLQDFAPAEPKFKLLLALCLRERNRDSESNLDQAKSLLSELVKSHPENSDYECIYVETVGLVSLKDIPPPEQKAFAKELEDAIARMERLNVLNAGIPRFVHLAAILKHKLSLLLIAHPEPSPEDYMQAVTLAEEAVELQKTCVELAPEIEAHDVGLGRMLQALSQVYLAIEDPVSAEIAIDAAIKKMSEKLDHEDPQIREVAKISMRIFLNQSAQCLRMLGSEEEADLQEMMALSF